MTFDDVQDQPAVAETEAREAAPADDFPTGMLASPHRTRL